jgi:hypothetical protein
MTTASLFVSSVQKELAEKRRTVPFRSGARRRRREMNREMNCRKFLPYLWNRRNELEMTHAQPRLREIALRVPDLRRGSHPFALSLGEARGKTLAEVFQDVKSQPCRAKGAQRARTAHPGRKTARARGAAKRPKGSR